MISYEAVINNLDEALFLFDKKGRLAFVNKAGEEFFGRGLKEIRLRTFKDLFSDVEDIVVLLQKTIREGRLFNCRDLEVDLPWLGGARSINVNISPYYLDNNLEGALLCIRENMSIAGREDYQFDVLPYLIGSIAHEIKNPLSGIKGAAQILKRELEGGSTEGVDLILKEAERLNLVLHSYLTMTKTPTFNQLNIHEVIEHALKVMGTAIHEKKVRMNKSYDLSLPAIRGDESKLLQVFINLLKNAVEAMADPTHPPLSKGRSEEGLHTLGITTRPSNEYMVIYEGKVSDKKKGKSRKQRWVVVTLEDSGIGIPRNEIEKIFLPFYTRKSGGSGLGLAISKKIIKDHGGTIRVKSKTGCGTAVSVYLPM